MLGQVLGHRAILSGMPLSSSSFAARFSIKTKVTLSMLALFLVGMWSLASYASHVLREDLHEVLGKEQFATASTMAAHLNREMEDRLQALRVTAVPLNLAMLTDRAAMQAYLQERPVLQRLFNGGVVVLDATGTAVAEVAPIVGRVGTNYRDIPSVATALQQGTDAIGAPVLGKRIGAPVFGMNVPIRDAEGRVIGVLSGLTNLGTANFIDSIGGANYGPKTSYMLIATPQRLVVTATDKQRAMEKLPMPGTNPLLDRIAAGFEGFDVMVSPQGAELLAAARGIPASGWSLVVALPTSEAFAPIHHLQRHVVQATLLLTVLAGILTWWLIKRQLDPLVSTCVALAHMSQSEAPTASLPITRQDEIGQLIAGINHLLEHLSQRKNALRQSEAFKNVVLNSVAAEIAVLDCQGVIQAVNEPWARFAVDNAAQPEFAAPNTGVGTNYLAVCEAATGSGDDLAAQAVRGIRSVLDGTASSFCMEYACHAPHEQRWFTLNVTPLGSDRGGGVVITHTNISALKRAEEALRIAAIAFECQEGMIVTNAQRIVLRTNASFARITGYANDDVVGTVFDFLRSERHDLAFVESAWHALQRDGIWNSEVWSRCKDGEVRPQWFTGTAVRDTGGTITHYVLTHVDISNEKEQEAMRQSAEAAHREALVREVHHRVKNSLQGVIGMLRQCAQKNPATAEPIQQAIGQVQGISVIHGLRGRTQASSVHLCELVQAIASEVSALWQTPVVVDLPPPGCSCVLAETEAVPMALVLNELIHNAVKHGGKAHGDTHVVLHQGDLPDQVLVTITNTGQLPGPDQRRQHTQAGLKLINSLLPRSGARLDHQQVGTQVVTTLLVQAPVIDFTKDCVL